MRRRLGPAGMPGPATRAAGAAGRADRTDSAFVTYGFPDAEPMDGMVLSGPVKNSGGEIFGVSAMQLFSEEAAAGDGAPVKGLSGAPLIVDGSLVGVMRVSLMKDAQERRRHVVRDAHRTDCRSLRHAAAAARSVSRIAGPDRAAVPGQPVPLSRFIHRQGRGDLLRAQPRDSGSLRSADHTGHGAHRAARTANRVWASRRFSMPACDRASTERTTFVT